MSRDKRRKSGGGFLSRLLCGGGSAVPVDEQNDFTPYVKSHIILVNVNTANKGEHFLQWLKRKFPLKKVSLYNSHAGNIRLPSMRKEFQESEAVIFLCQRRDLQYGFHELLAHSHSVSKILPVLDGKTLLVSQDTRNRLIPLGDYAIDDEVTLQHIGMPNNTSFDKEGFPGSEDLRAWLAFCFKGHEEEDTDPNSACPPYSPSAEQTTTSPTRHGYSGNYYSYQVSYNGHEASDNGMNNRQYSKIEHSKPLQTQPFMPSATQSRPADKMSGLPTTRPTPQPRQARYKQQSNVFAESMV